MSTLQLENIPDELTQRPQWVTWKNVDGRKIPLDAKTGKAAKSDDPATWATFEEAVTSWRHRHHTGIGYVFSADDPFVGIDLDDCIADDGTIHEWAVDILATMGSYAEVSPSGTGIKVWVKGTIPRSLKTKQTEIYDRARYFTVTGRLVDGAPLAIRSVNGELTKLYEALQPARPAETPQPLPQADLDAEHARRWCVAALDGERQKMLAAGDGERHNRRYASAFALGGLVHTGGVTEQEIFDTLAVNFGPSQANAEKTIRDGIRDGMEYPREIPAPRPMGTTGTRGEHGYLFTLGKAIDDNPQAEHWRQEAERWKAESELWQQKYQKLDEWREWAVAVAALPAERISPTAKLAAFSLWPEMQSRQEHGEAEPKPIWIEGAAPRAGMSPDTYGKKLKELASAGALVREERRDPMTGNKRIVIQPAAFAQPSSWALPEPRKHGGTQAPRPAPACPSCGDEAPIVKERTVITRTLCGMCDTELAEHTFDQRRETVWDPNPQLARLENDSREPPNPQLAGWSPVPSTDVAPPADSPRLPVAPAALPYDSPGFVDGLLARLRAQAPPNAPVVPS